MPAPSTLRQTVPIVAYHDIESEPNFREQVDYFTQHYNIISLEELRLSLLHDQPLKERPLAITFDDAYPSVYQKAFPILRERSLPAAIFAITALIGTDRPYWWDEIPYYLHDELDEAAKHRKVWEVKGWKNPDRLRFIEELKRKSPKAPLTRRQLSWEQLGEMASCGITIANHTHDHPLLHRTEEDEIRHTVRQAKQALGLHGLSGNLFAYPNGNSTPVTERILVEEGIEMAFLFDHQLNKGTVRPLAISRLSLNTRNSLWKTKLIMSGLHSRLLNLKKKIKA